MAARDVRAWEADDMSTNATEPVEIQCPYCGEAVVIVVDCSVESQSYIEDCQVCCRPMNLMVSIGEDGLPDVQALAEDEA